MTGVEVIDKIRPLVFADNRVDYEFWNKFDEDLFECIKELPNFETMDEEEIIHCLEDMRKNVPERVAYYNPDTLDAELFKIITLIIAQKEVKVNE